MRNAKLKYEASVQFLYFSDNAVANRIRINLPTFLIYFRNVPKPNCRQIADEQCRQVPKKECGRVPVQNCRQVSFFS